MKHIFVRSLLVLLFALVLVGNLFADDDLPFGTYPQALGAYVGRISGIGIGYQKWNDTYGFQFAAGGMYHPLMEGGHDIFNYNAGAQLQYPLFSDDYSTWLAGRLYVFGGLNHRGYKEAVYDESSYSYVEGDFHAEFGLGGGIGVEGVLFQHFAVSVELVYGLFWRPLEEKLPEQFLLEMLPQVSLRYRY
jgi:hypothetical protein